MSARDYCPYLFDKNSVYVHHNTSASDFTNIANAFLCTEQTHFACYYGYKCFVMSTTTGSSAKLNSLQTDNYCSYSPPYKNLKLNFFYWNGFTTLLK